MNETDYGTLLDITSRVEQIRGFARPDDFVTSVSDDTADQADLCPLIYCVDFKTQCAIYTVHDRGTIDAVLSGPFLYTSQLKNAKQILSLPLQHIDRTISTDGLRPTFIFTTGRAGSTLLTAMFNAIGKRAASEPDVFTQIAMLPPTALADSSDLDKRILAAAISNLSNYIGPDPVIKLRDQCNATPELIVRTVWNANVIFLLRDRRPWALSRHRAFGEPPRRIANVLVQAMTAIDRLQRIGVTPQVIWYDDLVAHPWATLVKIMAASALEPRELTERLTKALESDSQAGTALARDKVAGRRGDDDFLDRFEEEWNAAQPRALMDKLGLYV